MVSLARMTASADGLRQILPKQTKRIDRGMVIVATNGV
ncbi:hypothetical protein EJK54_0385 [Moraxella catarrhalis]|uniref:Uncharacterized protein n=1 Tax=Moraxella catarrhalis TaxID=480 RepID=A0ABY0BJ93_MORCA|nr:hypothetical protein EJK54_0385 [Moraxella catarrhalis]